VSKRQCYTTYTVDFLEQWSVVSERAIQDQSQFVKLAIDHIKAAHGTNKLIMVGHSMGSVVARLALKDRDHTTVTLLSLAAPLDKSPLSLDGRLGLDYSFRDIQYISICGGSSDIQIVPFAPSVDGRHQNTETIYMVWSSPDHQAIVWAHQVIEYLGRLIHSLS
jgi:alpha-beta hydrolase superfamily lysophospholipase